MKENLIHYRTCVCNINYHMVWSVKYRRKILSTEIESYLQELYRRLQQIRDLRFIYLNVERGTISIVLYLHHPSYP